MRIDYKSKVKDIYQHPVGRDVVDKILFFMKKPNAVIENPIIGNIRIRTLKWLLKKTFDDYFWEQLLWLLNSEQAVPSDENRNPQKTWWKEAVFYQIYPRSFQDSNGDGIGDLQGIYNRLDYLQSLGIDCIWLSPVYDSPNDDMGYDIRDYQKIMEEMGTMEDFDRLLESVHERGMKLIMDLVVNHTSDEHAWFQDALADENSPYRDYYFFREGTPDQAPNNWVSFFSGPAWRWFPEQERWSMHLFSSKQMDLNWDHPPVRKDIAQMVRWWLDKGVDGFRLDVINYISKRPTLQDGSVGLGELVVFLGIENYLWGPNLHRYLRELRQEAFDPYQAFSVGETPGIGIQMGRLLSGEDRGELDLVFLFDHLETSGNTRYSDYVYDLNYLKDYYINYHQALSANDWISVFFDNHDNPRMLSKVDREGKWTDILAKLLLTIQATMKGTPFFYQGQELGDTNQAFTSIHDMRDVEAINLYTELVDTVGEKQAFNTVLQGSRDHTRVPMQWDDTLYSGFSTTEPWLPRPEIDPTRCVARQEMDKNSVLHYFRELLSLRKKESLLRTGDVRFIGAKKQDYFAYFREKDGQRIFCEFNLSDDKKRRPFVSSAYRYLLGNYNHEEGIGMQGLGSYLEPYEANIFWVENT